MKLKIIEVISVLSGLLTIGMFLSSQEVFQIPFEVWMILAFFVFLLSVGGTVNYRFNLTNKDQSKDQRKSIKKQSQVGGSNNSQNMS